MNNLVYGILIAASALFSIIINSPFSRLAVLGFAFTFQLIVLAASAGMLFRILFTKQKNSSLLKLPGNRKYEWRV